ncbi:hypothetical protein BD289DRAFT_423834 [Coniella lustricola]|uniref:Uncharacterized protein n=1 Tax=Coniella lustricola TaxID=2025994 RepID=A0A2T3AJ02_9PEZI|nr:hypothetical protein BD289DRAFT_423834 [Coniella lustricola]
MDHVILLISFPSIYVVPSCLCLFQYLQVSHFQRPSASRNHAFSASRADVTSVAAIKCTNITPNDPRPYNRTL